jgi:hypothetical protein
MDNEQIMKNLETALEQAICQKAEYIIEYPGRGNKSIDITQLCLEAYRRIDLEKVKTEIAERLLSIMAEKLVASIVTEFGTDIKRMMSNAIIRKDLQEWLQVQTSELLKKVGDK